MIDLKQIRTIYNRGYSVDFGTYDESYPIIYLILDKETKEFTIMEECDRIITAKMAYKIIKFFNLTDVY